MTHLIGYAFDAAAWCENCTLERFEFFDDETVDDEGNPVHPIFDSEEVNLPMHCAGCGGLLDANLIDPTMYVFPAVYRLYQGLGGNPDTIREWWDAYVNEEDFAEWMVNTHPQVVAQLWAGGEGPDALRPEG